ncbi:hypothetical protein L208DRAFT_1482039 [Tricholoma matsutake]|nr:hypothetical protein L208DRAFT_1482039 [Tricholoma matsutake 945]
MPPRRPCLLSVNNEYLKNPAISQAMEHWHSMQLNSLRIFTKTFAKLKQDLINNLKDDHQWVIYTRDVVPDWLSNSNGISTDLVSGLDLLIHVLWLQSCNQDSDALSVLQLAQDEYFQTIPSKNNLIVEDVDSVDDSDSESQIDFDNNKNMPPKLTENSHLAWNVHYQESAERQLLLCQEWTNDLRQFFGIVRLIEFQNNIPLLAVVEALQQVRATDQPIWGTEYWRECVKSSGEILERWTPSAAFNLEIPKEETHLPPTPYSVETVIRALSSDGCIIPSASNLSSNFFLVSLHHLQAAYNSWLKPSLIKEGYNPVGWDLALMHRNLRGLNIEAFIKKLPGVMHPCLQLILELTSTLKNTNNKIQCNIFCPPVEGQSKVARKDGASQKDGDETGTSTESQEVKQPMVTSS